MYELVTDSSGVEMLKRENLDGSTSWIPIDPANSDYQAYLNPDKVEHLTDKQ
jgi:hypothetical protein